MLYIVGDYSKNLSLLNFSALKNVGIKALAYAVDFAQFYIIKNREFITNSGELLRKYSKGSGKGKIIKTTTLNLSDFRKRENYVLAGKIVKLLYVGRIDYSKGIMNIIDACELLIQKDIKVEFHLVGSIVKNQVPIDKAILKRIQNSVLENKIIIHGLKSVGEELFSFYRNSDIFVLASQSEGFPRVFWEAFANSLPVLTTGVGSIPYFLENRKHAIIMENGSPEEIADKILQMINSPELLAFISKEAYELAKNNTLDHQSNQISEFVKRSFI